MDKEKRSKTDLLPLPKIGCIFLAIVMVFILGGISQAREINFSYGENISWLGSTKNVGLESKMLELEAREPLTNWLKLGIVGNMIQSDKFAKPYVIEGENFGKGSYTTFIFSGRLAACKTFFDIMLIELYAGLGLTTQNHYPEFGYSGVIANLGSSIGVKLGSKYVVKYGFIHFSDPLQCHDKGHNFQYLSIGMTW